MKKILLNALVLTAFCMQAHAQLEMGTQVSYLTGHGKNDNHSSLMGAMIYGRFNITDNMAIGSAIHKYKPTRNKYTSGNTAYYATDDVTNIAATYELTLGDKLSAVQPYMGVDMGISTSHHNVVYTNNLSQTFKRNIKETYAMFSPKIGMLVSLGGSFGLYSQVQYNFSPGNGGTRQLEFKGGKGNTIITTEPISKYFNIDTGIYLQIGNRRLIP